MPFDPHDHAESSGLQRKLFLILGPLVVLLLVTAVAAIVLLQGVLADMSRVNRDVARTGNTISIIAARITALHTDDTLGKAWTPEALDRLHAEARGLTPMLATLDELTPLASSERTGDGRPASQRRRLGEMVASLGALIDAYRPGDRMNATLHAAHVLASADEAAHAMLTLASGIHDDLIAAQERLVTRFRWIVVGLTLAFLMLVNVAVVVLLRTARLILSPVRDLVDASRRLAREEFSCRVRLQGRDEFDELANAFNDLASQLQESDRRRMETLRQVARAVNHELNNALSILELQLEMIERRPESGIPTSQLHQIHETLERMTGTVRALGNVRRIVLTDYLPGTPMLDLERSSGTLDEPVEGVESRA
jgi:methyl-accepting chemotaxis protein